MEPIDVVILAGGKGTRLAGIVTDVPKPLAPVAGRPFLDYQFMLLEEAPDVGRVVLALGHLAERVIAHYSANPPALDLAFANETQPLGTGGGLRNALPLTTSQQVLVLNGDSIFHWDVAAIRARQAEASAQATIALLEVPDTSRYGAVAVADGRVTDFAEKAPGAIRPGLINAGAYLLERALVEALPEGEPFSIERDVMPGLAARGELAALHFVSLFIDIGLPETYAQAATFVPDLVARRMRRGPR